MRRFVVLPTVLALSTLTLAACGEESTDTGKVTVTGAFGSEPKVKYDGVVKREKTSVKVLTKGKGEVIEEGDSAYVEYYIGNGFTGEQALSSFEGETPPEMLTFKKDQLLGAFNKAVIGSKVGSRIEVLAAPDDAFGSTGGNADLGIGNKDTVVFVIDIVKKAPEPLTGPKGKTLPHPAGAPKLKLTKDVPTGFDFKGMTPAAKTTTTYTLIQGTGATVKAGSNVKVNYLGQTVGGEVFDGSYAKGTPFDFTVGSGVIAGWSKGLEGVKVGSRVVLVIPSAEGYGAAGSGEKIPANADLTFVVDVLAAS